MTLHGRLQNTQKKIYFNVFLIESDENEKSFKSELTGKKKDKKDKGYAALEGESSQDEDESK